MEQRRERRVHVQYPISFEGNQGVGQGRLFNLSAGGAGIEAGTSVQIGTTITLRVYVPTQKEPIQVSRANVTWVTGQDFGVEFHNMAPTEKELLEKLLTDLQQGKSQTH